MLYCKYYNMLYCKYYNMLYCKYYNMLYCKYYNMLYCKYYNISIGKNKEYKKEIIFYMDVLKTIHKKISNQKMKSRERDKSILEYVQCMYNNVHAYKVPGF